MLLVVACLTACRKSQLPDSALFADFDRHLTNEFGLPLAFRFRNVAIGERRYRSPMEQSSTRILRRKISLDAAERAKLIEALSTREIQCVDLVPTASPLSEPGAEWWKPHELGPVTAFKASFHTNARTTVLMGYLPKDPTNDVALLYLLVQARQGVPRQ